MRSSDNVNVKTQKHRKKVAIHTKLFEVSASSCLVDGAASTDILRQVASIAVFQDQVDVIGRLQNKKQKQQSAILHMCGLTDGFGLESFSHSKHGI